MTIEPHKPKSSAFVHCCFPVFFALSLAPFVTGCGSTAIITRSGLDRPTEAEIVRSDHEMMYVRGRSGDEFGIEHRDVVYIDHPGNVAAIIGGVVTAYGVANIHTGVPKYCEGYQDDNGAGCVGVFLPAAIGGAVMIYGVAVWARSVFSSVQKSAPQSASRVTVVPIASVDKKNEFIGASAHVSF